MHYITQNKWTLSKKKKKTINILCSFINRTDYACHTVKVVPTRSKIYMSVEVIQYNLITITLSMLSIRVKILQCAEQTQHELYG